MNLEEIMINKCIDFLKESYSECDADPDIEEYGQPSLTMILEYYDAVRRTEHYYKRTLRKRWQYSNGAITELSIESEPEELSKSGMFYTTASAKLYWDLDRNKAFIGMVFGPRYGRGYSFDIKTDGDAISLENEHITWVS